MNVKDAICERKSIRGYLDRAVSKETLEMLMKDATRAISAVNAQPWKFYIAAGETLENIRRENQKCVEMGLPAEISDIKTEGVYRQRRVEVAKQLFGAMGIAKEDKLRRSWWGNRGINFFGAPAAIVVTVDKSMKNQMMFDMGCVVQNLCIAAMEYGLGTCVADQPLTYKHVLESQFNIPETEEVVCGIAIGYPDPDFPANHVRTSREDMEKIVKWFGFER